jgi:hypothetical protein
MKAYKGVDVYSHIFLTSALAGGKLSASRPGRFTPRERTPGAHWRGGWVDTRARLDDVKEKFLTLPGLVLRPLGRPAHSQSLYRITVTIKKGKCIPLTGREGPCGSWDVDAPIFPLENRLTDGGKVVSLTRRPPFTFQEHSWYSFLLEAKSTPGS